MDLAAHLADVGDRPARRLDDRRPSVTLRARRRARSAAARRATRRRRPLGSDDLDRLGERVDADHLEPSDQSRLLDRRGGDHDTPQAAPREHGDHRKHAGTARTSPPSDSSPIERDAARPRSHLLGSEQDPDRHREVE